VRQVVEEESEVDGAESYLKTLAKDVGADVKVTQAKEGIARSIIAGAGEFPNALASLTTHGRSGLLDVALGSVALDVVRGVNRPVLIYRPRGDKRDRETQVQINNVVVALDGSSFSEAMLPFAAELAQGLKTKLTLLQTVQPAGKESRRPRSPSADELASLVDTGIARADVMESSYLHGHAHDTRSKFGLEVEWEVLHGDADEAIPDYVKGKRDVILAMASHARPRLERTIFGSVTAACLRRAGVPVLVYWPH
ncbi:MAG TPA: universal stress protein, partial [Dehalococcoidia bacterium]|nr:universal stress protein [Dehalococcoidia bacterium]